MSNILTNSFNLFAPKISKQVRGKPFPWLTHAIKKVMNERDKLLRKSHKSHISGIKDEYKRKHNQVNSMSHTTKSNYTRTLLKENAYDPIKFWSTIKRIFPCKSKKYRVEQSFDIDGFRSK